MAIKDMYLTISEAAKELGASRQTIYRWIADNKIPTEKIGGVILVDKDKLRKYFAQKSFKKFSQMMDGHLKDTVRRQLGYSKDDKIEEVDKSPGHFAAFVVTKNNGTREKVEIGGMELTLSTDGSRKGLQFAMRLKDAEKTAYKQPKKDKKEEK